MYEVFEDGTIAKLFEPGAYSMIEHHGHLFASNWNGIYGSTDGGTTWELAVYSDRGTLFEVDGRLCLKRGSGIYLIDLEAGTIAGLSRDGLPVDPRPMGAAAQFGDRVYVGARDGLYTKSVGDFFSVLSPD
jgi:hypothetical protein